MRIQHNVTALNAYRNLRGNNTNLARNLEKLASGYRINRAGDDAAGLAISEKMRAQISGLDAAKQNAQDGISLVQTAEGALTEVHSMLNRMVTLATQSSNGTYDNEVDRANLQKEVSSLKKEIDRIADSANYNGIKLLDGSMSNESITRGNINVKMNSAVGATDLKAAAGVQKVTFLDSKKLVDGGKLSFSINYKDESGADKVKTFDFKVEADATDTTGKKGFLVDANGNKTAIADIASAKAANEIGKAIDTVIRNDKELGKLFDVTVDASKSEVTFTAKTKGTSGATVTGASQYIYNADGALDGAGAAAVAHDTVKVEGTKAAADAGVAYDFTDKGVVFGGADGAYTDPADINKAIFEINGEKFLFTNEDLTKEQWDAVVKSGAHHVRVNAKGANAAAEDLKEMADKISQVTGLNVQNGDVADGVFTKKNDGTFLRIQHSGKPVDKSLTLQIGDTPDEFNKMKVSIKSTSTKSLGIDGVDISTQDGAASALSKIRNAINTVSSVRGDMGALQNRLEHTINNLGVMHENITDAESRIRDTDMAKEMMAYAKNNILVQSSTAMLAQANQLPQGVLQLLQ